MVGCILLEGRPALSQTHACAAGPHLLHQTHLRHDRRLTAPSTLSPLPAPVRLPALQINNEEAIKFYSRFGFKVAETIQGYYKRLDPPDAVLLRKQLQGGSGGGGDGGGAGSANGASA